MLGFSPEKGFPRVNLLCLLWLIHCAHAFTGYTAFIWLILSVYGYLMISLEITLHKIIYKKNHLFWKYVIQHGIRASRLKELVVKVIEEIAQILASITKA